MDQSIFEEEPLCYTNRSFQVELHVRPRRVRDFTET
jgi:hypothetical protein